MLCECGKHGARIVGPGAVIERENHLLHLEEVVHLVLLEPEARTAGGIDLDRARYAEGIGIAGALTGTLRLSRNRERKTRGE
jgi:hypothetical protein